MTDRPETILIVDDDLANRIKICQDLSTLGFNCEEAGNADQVWERLKNNAVQLILLDIGMQDESGAKLLSELRMRCPDVAVIISTEIDDLPLAIQCIKQGAYDYLTKPIALEEIVPSIKSALDNRRSQLEQSRMELESKDYQQHLEQKLEEQSKKIRASLFNAITALAYAMEAKDKYINGHSQRVTESSLAVAKALGIAQESIEKIRLAGLIHDIGKIGIKSSILNKPGGLTPEEYQHVKSHSEVGERILTPIIEDKEILSIVRHHHERYDGTGYPDGLEGEEIPLGARVLAVSDAYDAMTSERPYRKAMSIETACAEIERGKGTQFDPVIAQTLLELSLSNLSVEKV